MYCFQLIIGLIVFYTSSCSIINDKNVDNFSENVSRPKFEMTTNIDDALARTVDKMDDSDRRIIGGSPAQPATYPFMVSLQSIAGAGYYKFCGGSILTPTWIITAAHCYEDYRPLPIINAGTTEANQYSGTSQVRNIIRIVKHPQYIHDPYQIVNDIALLQLDKPLEFNRYVQAISLPSTNHNAEQIGTGKVMGWGAIHPTNHVIASNSLLVRDIRVMEPSTCAKYWPINNKVVCLTGDGYSGPCMGDSGGPFVQYVNGKPVAVGLTSYVSAQSCLAAPAVYTRVDKYLSFIRSVIG